LIAGARCVVVTLWPIRDRFAARFAPAFFEHWSGEVTAAEALAATQRLFLDSEPTGWASFAVLGDPGVRRPVVATLSDGLAVTD
jgi:CHAT domain-containing protein